MSLRVINWRINPIVLRVEWWFDGKHFSFLNHMKSNCTSYSICLQSCSESDGQRDWFQTAAVRDVVNTVELQSVSECQFHMRSHDSVGAFLDCLPD